jgi:Xaa-Pro aminopeptidase
MDDYETHDDRRLVPGTGFTIEPGVYFPDFGVRTEINMVMGAREAAVTGPLQTEILPVWRFDVPRKTTALRIAHRRLVRPLAW